MKTLLDKDFEYTPAIETDISKRFRHADIIRNIGVLEEVAEFLDNQSDVKDGPDGPVPNTAMSLLREVEALIAKLKESV